MKAVDWDPERLAKMKVQAGLQSELFHIIIIIFGTSKSPNIAANQRKQNIPGRLGLCQN
jgi:hypothetical protein